MSTIIIYISRFKKQHYFKSYAILLNKPDITMISINIIFKKFILYFDLNLTIFNIIIIKK